MPWACCLYGRRQLATRFSRLDSTQRRIFELREVGIEQKESRREQKRANTMRRDVEHSAVRSSSLREEMAKSGGVNAALDNSKAGTCETSVKGEAREAFTESLKVGAQSRCCMRETSEVKV